MGTDGRRIQMKLHRSQWMFVWLGMFSVNLAWADAIPAPSACPPGSLAQVSHSGTDCAVWSCGSDSDCEHYSQKGNTCEERRVCTIDREERVYSHRRQPPRDPDAEPRTVTRTYVVGSCPTNESCTGREEAPPRSVRLRSDDNIQCETQRVCVAPSLPPLPTKAWAMSLSEPDDVEANSIEENSTANPPTDKASSQSNDAPGCGLAPGVIQSIPLALAALIGGTAMVRRRES